jgi:hypothetical protein
MAALPSVTTSTPVQHPDGSITFATTIKPAPTHPHPVPPPLPTAPKVHAMKIQITNHSTTVSMADAMTMTIACASQLRNEFAPSWGFVPPDVEFNANGVEDPSAYQMGIFDTSDQPGALGYHDNDTKGRPRGFVFAKTTKDNGGNISTTLSHELCEMVLDPSCTLWTQTSDGNMRALEACDAVENDEYDVTIGTKTIKVSNFLLPAYFSASAEPGVKTDYLNKLGGAVAPAMTPGGYDIVQNTTGQASQEFARQLAALPAWKAAHKALPGSRTGRRAARLKTAA